MKNLLMTMMVAGMIFGFTSCKDDDSPVTATCTDGIQNGDETGIDCGGTSCIACSSTLITKSGTITADESWTSDAIYVLDGRVIVADGVTLTIEAGTIIKGEEGEAENASVLIVAQGGKLEAVGTATAPIIFTTILDDIDLGQTQGTNLSKTDNETWGGIIILGYAPISAKTGDDVAAIEGLPANAAYGVYGGTDPADNSGTLKYVSIRHGGITIGEGNEINGLTLGGVGSGTTIDNIEIYATLDDGIEFFGGTVDVTNLVIAWQGDDGIDIDQNYAGTVDNFIVSHGAGVGTDEGFEIDGPENTLKDGKFTLKNGTVINDGGTTDSGTAADLKSDAQGTFNNIIFKGYDDSKNTLKFEGEYLSDGSCTRDDLKVDALGNLLAGEIVITKTNFGSIKVYSKKDDTDTALCNSIPAEDQSDAEAMATTDNTATGASNTTFSWTLSAAEGLLN